MVLGSYNSGKYLTNTWNRERSRCMMDSSGYTEAEKEYYEVQGQNVFEGSYQSLEDIQANIETTPIDPLTEKKRIDHRNNPWVGW